MKVEPVDTHRISISYSGDDEGAVDFARELYNEFGVEAAVERRTWRGDWEWFLTSGKVEDSIEETAA